MTGYPTLLAALIAPGVSKTVCPLGRGILTAVKSSSKRSLSSALSILSTLEPIIFIPHLANGPAKLIAVCPPNCTITPSGCSRSITFKTSSKVKGSKYNLSEVSKSVLTVSGLLLIIIVSYPSSFKAHTECTEQ